MNIKPLAYADYYEYAIFQRRYSMISNHESGIRKSVPEYLYDNIRMYGNGHVNQQNRPPGFWQHKVVIWKQTRRERRLEILVFSL